MLRVQVCILKDFFPDADETVIANCAKELFKCESGSVDVILADMKQVDVLNKLPLIPQRSPEWYDLRTKRLTASDLAQSMGKGKFGSRKELLYKKAFPDKFPFKVMPALKWGTMMEDVGMRCYKESEPAFIQLYEFGLIPHKDISCFGASPDGITNTGVMVEMKCPYSRQCTNEVPEQYYLQIQGQLATCGLNLCHYVECYFDTFVDVEEYVLACRDLGGKGHGVVLERGNGEYVYSPEDLTSVECEAWVKKQKGYVKVVPWKLKHMFKTDVPFNLDVWESCIPEIYKFWKEVEEQRKTGFIEPVVKKELDMTSKYVFIEDSDEEEL